MQRIMIGLLLMLLILGGGYWLEREANAWLYSKDLSPDGRFQIEVYGYPRWWAMPGDSSGGPGYVQLVDLASGKVLKRHSLDMLMLMESIQWHADSVELSLPRTRWALPK